MTKSHLKMKSKLCRLCLFITGLATICSGAVSQPLEFSLEQAVQRAQKNSFDMFRARTMYRVSELDYRDFQTELKPHLSLQLTPLNYNRSITEEYNSELMKYEPVEIQRITSQYNLSISQPVKFTGGQISTYSSLLRSQRFGGGREGNLDFTSTPVSVSYRQNFSQINTYRWKAKIEPLKFEQAKLEYIEQREEISARAVSLFFSLLGAQMNLDIARMNMEHAGSLIDMGKKRERIGSITRDDVLNLELKQVNAQISVQQAEKELEDTRLDFCEFLELPLNTKVKCLVPEKVRLVYIDPARAQQLAGKNNPGSHQLEQKLLEVQKQVSTARRSMYDISLEAAIGLNQNREVLSEAFQDLLDRQNFRVALNIPVLDWKENKRQVERARLNLQVTEAENRKTRERLLIEVAGNAGEFNMKAGELSPAARADTFSRSAYRATRELFLQGKATVIAINESYRAMYSARNQYLSALRNYWFYYYTVRKLCLFDFEKSLDLRFGFDDEVKTLF